jgi:hypothetical protein
LRRTVRPRDRKKRQSHLRDAPNSSWLTDPSLSELSGRSVKRRLYDRIQETYHVQPGNVLVIGAVANSRRWRCRACSRLGRCRSRRRPSLNEFPGRTSPSSPYHRLRRLQQSGLQLRCWFHVEATAGARLLALCSCHRPARHSRLRPNARSGRPRFLDSRPARVGRRPLSAASVGRSPKAAGRMSRGGPSHSWTS